MLTGAGVTVVWKLGIKVITDPASTSPLVFDRLWWMVIVAAAVILIIGRTTGAFEVGHIAAVLAATVLTLAGWVLVQRWGFHHLYELVPAFVLATAAALGVSALFSVEEEEAVRDDR
jgi:hypothetical protein